MLPQWSRNSKLFCFLFVAIVYLNYHRPRPEIHITQSIQYEYQNEEFGDLLFSLFFHLGIAQSLDRIPVLNVQGEMEFVAQLSSFSSRFPQVLDQFMIVIEPRSSPNAELGMRSFEDPIEKLSAYKTPDIIVRMGGPRSFKYFHSLRSRIRHWMIGDAEQTERSRGLIPKKSIGAFKICVHGSEEKTTETHNRTDNTLTILALDHLLKEYSKDQKEMTVVLTNMGEKMGPKIMEHSKFSNFTGEKVYLNDWPPGEQLTLSILHCDVVLITIPTSSLGWWMGYLARDNSTVFFADPKRNDDWVERGFVQEDYFPKEWKKIIVAD